MYNEKEYEMDEELYEEVEDEYDEDFEEDDEEEEYVDPDENCAMGFDCDCSDCNVCGPYGGPSYCPYRITPARYYRNQEIDDEYDDCEDGDDWDDEY